MRRIVAFAACSVAVAVLPQCSSAPAPPAAGGSSLSAVRPHPGAPAGATIRPVTAAELGASWHPGCPVGPDQLRRVGVNHLGFDGRPHRGELIVHEHLVSQVVVIFEQLYRLRYPIDKMRPADRYPNADDELSMEDDNTSAFNCRRIQGSGRWALHAYGRAIDLNPLLNPSVHGDGTLEPRNAAAYLDRNHIVPGLLHDGDPAVRAFIDRGWRWGGRWRSPVDYQHFETGPEVRPHDPVDHPGR